MEERTKEEWNKFQEKTNQDLYQLGMYFSSMNYDIERIQCVISLFLSCLLATEKIDEEDLRDMFRVISKMKDRIEFR